MKKPFLFLSFFVGVLPSVHARPLLTEPVETLGFLNFEGGMSLSQREDRFGPGSQKYETINFPVYAKFGIRPDTDFGFELRSIHQHYQNGSTQLSGAITGDFSPQLKFSPWSHAGVQAIWRLAKSEDKTEDLSIAHGNDAELNALFYGPDWPVKSHLNVGYVWKGHYNSQFGVSLGSVHQVHPGNIFQTKLAFETPLVWHIQALVESAYYKFDQEKVDGNGLVDSGGEAADLLTGLTWSYGTWNFGAGVSFGLLDERHTSFDLVRGAGDTTLTFALSYKLTPHKPEK